MGYKKLSLNNTSSSTNFYYLLFRNMTLCSVVFIVLILFVFTMPYSLAAPNAVTDNVSISIPVACTMSGTVVSPHAASTIGGILEEDIGTTKINTACNDKNGYVVYAIGNTGGTEGSTVLSSILGSDYDIPTGALDSDSSAWAMKLSAVPGDYAPEIMPAFANYTNIPNVWTKVASRASATVLAFLLIYLNFYAIIRGRIECKLEIQHLRRGIIEKINRIRTVFLQKAPLQAPHSRTLLSRVCRPPRNANIARRRQNDQISGGFIFF